jgi:hypothetical protein
MQPEHAVNPVMEWKQETGSGTTGKEPGDGDSDGGGKQELPKFRSRSVRRHQHITTRTSAHSEARMVSGAGCDGDGPRAARRSRRT